MKQTIALIDTATGWVFQLHNDNHRVWLNSYPTDAPVPVSYFAGARAAEFELTVAACDFTDEMVAAARRILPGVNQGRYSR